MSINVNSFRDIALTQHGNVKIKETPGGDQEVMAKHGFKSWAVTLIKNAFGRRDEKNSQTIMKFEETMIASGKYDSQKIGEAFTKLRAHLNDGHGRTMQACDVKQVFRDVGDRAILAYDEAEAASAAIQSRHRGQSNSPSRATASSSDPVRTMQDAMMTGGAAIIRSQMVASADQFASNAHGSLNLVKGSETYDSKWFSGSGVLRSTTASMQSLAKVSTLDGQFKAQHADLLEKMSGMMDETIAGVTFENWGDPETKNRVAANYGEVRPQLIDYLERLSSLSDEIKSALS